MTERIIPEAKSRSRLLSFIKEYRDKTGADPGGDSTNIQYNDGGDFGASKNLNYNGLTLQITGSRDQLRLSENSADNTTFNHNSEVFTISVDGGGNAMFMDTKGLQVGKATFGVNSPKVAFEVHYSGSEGNLDPARSGNISSNEGGGEVVYYGTGTLTAGKIHYLETTGVWTETDADSKASGGNQLLGISLGTDPQEDGILLRGYFNVSPGNLNGIFAAGKPLYLGPDSGEFDIDAPGAAGAFVRVVGHCTTLANVIYFNPSATYVEIS
jgi:hypothetical protein